jgi:hypothetical protein
VAFKERKGMSIRRTRIRRIRRIRLFDSPQMIRSLPTLDPPKYGIPPMRPAQNRRTLNHAQRHTHCGNGSSGYGAGRWANRSRYHDKALENLHQRNL